jgi:hypothetical protein
VVRLREMVRERPRPLRRSFVRGLLSALALVAKDSRGARRPTLAREVSTGTRPRYVGREGGASNRNTQTGRRATTRPSWPGCTDGQGIAPVLVPEVQELGALTNADQHFRGCPRQASNLRPTA